MNENKHVTIKGIKNGILVELDPAEEWLRVTEQLAQQLDEQSEFYRGANVTVDLSTRPVPKHEMTSLKALLGPARAKHLVHHERERNQHSSRPHAGPQNQRGQHRPPPHRRPIPHPDDRPHPPRRAWSSSARYAPGNASRATG